MLVPLMNPLRCRPSLVVAAIVNAAVAFGLLGALGSLGGCDSAKQTGAAGARTDDAMVAGWRKAGLDVGKLVTTDAAPFQANACSGGVVGGIDVVLCSYGTAEDAKAAEDLGLATIGAATGASRAHGTRLLVVADRRKADPSGRTIETIMKTFGR
jgi:hypothetical protein